MAKTISLSTGRVFNTISSAKEYFAGLLDSQQLKEPFSGEGLIEIHEVYVGYCEATDWPLPSKPMSFYPTEERGAGYTTRCYGVTYANGESASFSMPKALTAVAK